MFIVFTRTHLELTDIEAYGFLGLYALFLVWMTLESVGAIETVGGICGRQPEIVVGSLLDELICVEDQFPVN